MFSFLKQFHRIRPLDGLQLFLICANVWLLPLVFHGDVHQPFELPKIVLFRISGALLLFLLVLRIERGAANLFTLAWRRVPVLTVLIGLLIVWQIVALIFSINQITFIVGDYRKRFGLYTIFFLAVQAYATTDLALRRPRLFMNCVCLLAPLFCIWNAGEYIQLASNHALPADFRFRGSQGQSNFLAGFAVLSIGMMYVPLRLVRTPWLRGWFVLGLLSAVLLVLTSGSRTGLALLVLLFLLEAGRLLGLRGVAIAILLTALALTAVLFLDPGLSIAVRRFSFNDVSGHMHSVIWEAGLRLIAERPLVGYGYGNIVKIFALGLHAAGFQESILVDRSHNELLDLALYIGLPGVALVLGAHLELVRSLWLKRKTFGHMRSGWSLLTGAALVSLVWFWGRGLVNINAISHYSAAAFFLGLLGAALLRATRPGPSQAQATGQADAPRRVSYYAVLVAALSLTIIGHNLLAFLGDRAFHRYATTQQLHYLRAASKIAPFVELYRVQQIKTVNHRQDLRISLKALFPPYMARQSVNLREYYHGMGEMARERRNYFFAAYYFGRAVRLDPLRTDYPTYCANLPSEFRPLCEPGPRPGIVFQ